MVQTFLELIKAHTVVEVDIEVSVSFSHTLESIRYLNPNQIKNSLKRTTLINHIVRRRSSISIATHKIENVCRIITQRQFLHWQINEQINNITKLHQVNFIAYLNLLQNQWLDIIKYIQHLIRLELLPDRKWHQMVLLQLFRIEQSIFESGQHTEIDVLFVHFSDNFMLSLVKHLLIVNFVKMIQVDLVFIADHIMDKAVTLLNMF